MARISCYRVSNQLKCCVASGNVKMSLKMPDPSMQVAKLKPMTT